jgi:hypothetical protein
MLSVRPTLAASAGPGTFLSDRPTAWLLLLATPLSIVVLHGLLLLRRRMQSWLVNRRNAFSTRINEQLQEASSLLGRDPAAAASALERALYLAIEARFQIKGRGVLRPQLAELLSHAGVPTELCQQINDCLETCDSVRFAPLAQSTLRELQQRAQSIVEQLLTSARATTRAPVERDAGAPA